MLTIATAARSSVDYVRASMHLRIEGTLGELHIRQLCLPGLPGRHHAGRNRPHISARPESHTSVELSTMFNPKIWSLGWLI